MSFFTLSIHATGHDSSYALFNHDKLIVFCSAERHTRIKSGKKLSSDFLKSVQQITERIDLLVAICDNGSGILSKIIKTFKCDKIITLDSLKTFQFRDRNLEKYFSNNGISHHDIHALSAFYMSPFSDAVSLVIDGYGDAFHLTDDGYSGIVGVETSSIIEIEKNYDKKTIYKRIQYFPATFDRGISSFTFDGGINNIIEKVNNLPIKCDVTSHLDIGNMYFTISKHLGFGMNGSGKVMGLSAYGNSENDLPPFLVDETNYANSNVFNQDNMIDISTQLNLHRKLEFQEKANIAYEVQKCLEKIFLHHAKFIINNSEKRNLIIGGGCALNILGASLIKENYPEFNIFVDPIANDATQSIGWGLFLNKHFFSSGNLQKSDNFNSIYLGPVYTISEISEKIDNFISKFKEKSDV